MTALSVRGRRIAGVFLWLALFSALYTAGDALEIWPRLPPGALQDLDLAVGALGLAVLAAALLFLRRPSA